MADGNHLGGSRLVQGMCVHAPRATAGADDEAVAADTLLRRTRWSAREVSPLELMPGHSRRLGDVGIRFLHVAEGHVAVASSQGSDGPGPDDVVVPDLQSGDFVLLPRGGEHHLRAAPQGRARLVTGSLVLHAAPFDRLSELMPPVLLQVGLRLEQPAYASLLDMLDAETRAARAGGSPLLNPLLDLVVSATLRSFFERGCASAREWLGQLHDPLLGPALEAIHAEPGSPWTVDSLARVVRASRSSFAERFRSTMGESPARYVTRVRMRRAEEMLVDGRPVSQVAFSLGYDSDEGFRRAFQRHSGLSPSEWRRTAVPA